MKKRHVLFGVFGDEPSIITLSLWYLKTKIKPIDVERVVIITTQKGKDILLNGMPDKKPPLLKEKGAFEAFCTEYNTHPQFGVRDIYLIDDNEGHSLEDVKEYSHFEYTANKIVTLLQEYASQPDTELHCIYAGGRRIMSVYLGLALTMLGRKNDHFYYLRHPQGMMTGNFFFPAKDEKYDISLEEIPFARLGEKYRNIINTGSYSDLVRDCQKYTDWSKAPFSISAGKDVDIITHNTKFQELLSKIKKVAENGTADNYFLYGESGCGKEIVAEYIHKCNRVAGRKGKIVRINCADFQTSLIETELFGYIKGSHDQANETHYGLISEAEEGTLFLDEINSTDTVFQAKLLRFLENRTYRMVGDTKDILINVVVIFATNEKPLDLVREKRMRNDFYQRISTFGYTVPPLRERPEDYELLASYFLEKFGKEYKKPNLKSISNEVLRWLKRQDFINSNVRGLRDTIRRMVVYCHEDQRLLDSLPKDSESDGIWGPPEEESTQLTASGGIFDLTYDEFQKYYFKEQLKIHGGNVTKMSEALNLNRSTLNSKLQDLGIEPGKFKNR